jgi:hypothetical protein
VVEKEGAVIGSRCPSRFFCKFSFLFLSVPLNITSIAFLQRFFITMAKSRPSKKQRRAAWLLRQQQQPQQPPSLPQKKRHTVEEHG